MSVSRRLGGSLLLAALPATAAFAQAGRDSARADTATRLKEITVTESRAAAVVGGASAVVLRPGALRSSPAPLLEQALREAPFVHVRQNSRGEMELSVRGSDSRQVAVLYDGVPITLGWDHRTDPSLIPITGAQRIVIVRGLASVLHGPNTLGGVIEISHDEAFARAAGNQLWGGAGIDDNAAYVASLGGAGRLGALAGGQLSLRGAFARRQRDGLALSRDAVDPTAVDGLRTNSDLAEIDGFVSLRWNTASGGGIGLTVTAFDAERGVPPEEHIGGPRLWRYPYHTRMITALSASTGSFTTPFGSASIDVGMGYNSGRLKIESFEDRTYQTLDAEELGDERTWTGRALVTHSLPKGASVKAAITGADVRYEEMLAPAAGVDYRQKLLSAGAEVEVPFGGTSVAGGLVYDHTSTPETGGRTPAQPFDNLGWRAGISHELSDAVRLHASASRRSRYPALRELYSGALNRFTPNPDLKPERLLGFEGGFSVNRAWGPIPSGTIQLTGFHHRLDDAVIRITLSNPTRFMRVNRDRIESTGVEALAGFVFGEDRERAVTLTADALIQNITVFDITTAGEPSRHAENNPEIRSTVELGLPLPLSLRGYANARYTGTQYCLNADTQSEDRLDGRAEGDLALEKRFDLAGRGLLRSLSALVSLDNATDATVFDQCGLPQPGRTLRVMFTFR